MTEHIKFPYSELSEIELKRVQEFIKFHKVDYKDIYVYYTTEQTLGVGYNIIVSLTPVIVSLTPVKKDEDEYDFGETARNITDTDNLIDNF